VKVAMSAVRLRFVGAGDAFGSGGRFQTCLLLEGAGDAVLVDCGASSLVALKRAGVDPADIGAVLLSHLHGDHFGGVPFLILDAQFSRRVRPLVIAGPPGVQARVEAAMEVFFPGSTRVARKFATTFVELRAHDPSTIGPATATPFPVVHESGAPSYALRVEYGHNRIAYSGDTEWTESLVDAARDTDLFVCEAYSFDRRIRYHLDYATLCANADRIESRRIVLTHMGPDMLAHQEDSRFECASDGLVIEL
jgi:ribonuclease BN (tRNA processing enzyme)